MTRLASLLLAFWLLPGIARAQAPATAPAAAVPAERILAAPAASPSQAEIDRQIQEAVQREVAKVKEQLRDEMRAEVQGAQSAAQFLGEQEEKKKLQLLELNGYFRFRWDLFTNLNLGLPPDPEGWYLWLGRTTGVSHNGTQTGGNMRLRVDPTFNVSEQVRIRATIDFLDNVALGSTPVGPNFNQFDFFAASQVPPRNWFTDGVAVKRVWGEVQTPIGLLSFGRMPAQWGMGIYQNAGNGIDQDFGDNVDRIQFAIPIGQILGGLALIPYFDWSGAGVTTSGSFATVGVGQPVNLTDDDDVGAIGIRIVREDTPEQQRRKLEKGLSSLSYGLLFNYRSQRFAVSSLSMQAPPAIAVAFVNRDASAATLDLFGRWVSKRFEFEAEVVGIYGSIGNASFDPAVPVGPVDIRQAGGALRGKVKLGEGGKLVVGAEFGIASGDKDPGMGNFPGRSCDYTTQPVVCVPPRAGSIDGQQFNPTQGGLDVNNYRFNPAYQVDLILWRRLLGTVTDAWYVKPTLRWDVLEGLNVNAQVVYSQALNSASTPSSINQSLGVELDLGVKYQSDDGFVFVLEYGLLKPLSGLGMRTSAPGDPIAVQSASGVAQNLHAVLGIVF